MVYKQQNNLLPDIFSKYFTKAREVHNHSIRNQRLFMNYPTNESGKKMLKYQGPHLWNRLPQDITNSKSLPNFKKNLKKFYLKEQNG
jgi:hypothetical protein